MKKTTLHAALLALTLPLSVYGFGLGEMKVESSLDQPFKAEIELIDVDSASAGDIKVALADPENFERIGLERTAILSLLNFKIERNASGKSVIKVESTERMTEPFMELVVDVAWPNGQLFKAYTVLLDPPGYDLVSSTASSSSTRYSKNKGSYTGSGNSYGKEAGVVDKTVISTVDHNPVKVNDSKGKSTFGPTIPNENIWQIAQRYKTSDVILAQVVLAIVGANPDAFTDANLNGLKVGSHLNIPATKDIQRIPVDLALEEVAAHDTAWNEKKSVNHRLLPPYTDAQPAAQNKPVLPSELPSVPKLSVQNGPSLSSMSQLINVSSALHMDNQAQANKPTKQAQNEDQDTSTTKAELAITTAAIESVRESNSLLMEQLHLMQDQNKKLQLQLEKRDKDMEAIRTQMQVLMKERLALASQASTTPTQQNTSSLLPLFLLFVVVAGGAAAVLVYFKRREQEQDESSYLSSQTHEPNPFIPPTSEPVVEESHGTQTDAAATHSLTITKSDPEAQITKVRVEPEVKEEGPADESVYVEEELAKTVEYNSPVKATTEQNETTKSNEPNAPEEMESNLIEPAKLEHSENDLIEPTPIEEAVIETPPDVNIDIPSLVFDTTKSEPIPSETPVSPEDVMDPNETGINFEPDDSNEIKIDPIDQMLMEQSPGFAFNSVPAGEEHQDTPIHIENSPLTETTDDESGAMLEFETGLHQVSNEDPPVVEEKSDIAPDQDSLEFFSSPIDDDFMPKARVEKTPEETPKEPEPSVDFNEPTAKVEVLAPKTDDDASAFLADYADEPVEIEQNTSAVDESAENVDATESAPLLKSGKALDTLLDLAKTYVSMSDFESARYSLEEIVAHGSESQKAEAAKLLEEIKGKS